MFAAITDPQNMLAITTFLAVFATILVLVMPMLARDTLGNRMKSVALERDQLRARERARVANESKDKQRRGAKKREPGAIIKLIVDKLNLRKALADENTEEELVHAGFRGQSPLFIFLGLRFGLPFLLGGIAVLYYYVFRGVTPEDGKTPMLYCIGAAGAGFYLPLFIVRQIKKSRQLSITQAWPDALDLSLICVESGMSIEAAFRKVAAEIGPQSIALAEELMITTAELSFLQERRTAYENLTRRTGLDSVKNVVLSLIQSEKYGTPLSNALRVLAQENRDIRMALAEKKAASLPPKLTVPMMVCFLPALFCVILGPAVIRSYALFDAQ